MKLVVNILSVGLVLAVATSASFASTASGCGMCGMGSASSTPMQGCPMNAAPDAKSSTKKSEPTTAAPVSPKVRQVKCAVTGKIIGTPQQAAGSTVYNGKTYYFCCPGCLPKFKA